MTVVVSPPPAPRGGPGLRERMRRRGAATPDRDQPTRLRPHRRAWWMVRTLVARCDAGVRLVGLLALLVTTLGLFGLTLRAVVTHRLEATDNLVTHQGRALATAQELRAALSQADAAAAAEVFASVELLVDRDAPAGQLRQRYDGQRTDAPFQQSVAESARDLLDLRRLDPGLCAPDADTRRASVVLPPITDPGALADGPGGDSDPSEGDPVDGAAPAVGDPADDAGRAGSMEPPWSEQAPAAAGPGPDTLAPGLTGAEACPLDLLAEAIPVYNGMVERARANNRAGLSVGEANLRAASTMMRGEILPATEILVERYADAVDLAYQRATGAKGEWAVVVTAALALGSLLGAQVLLVRRTNRLINPGLVLATAAVLTAITWTAVGFGTQQTRLDTGRDAGYRPMTLLARSKTLALEARVDENLSLAALGNGLRFDEHFAWVARGLGFDAAGDRLPPEPVTRRGSLVVALDNRRGADLPPQMEADLRSWLQVRDSVVRLLASSPDSVVAAARGPGDAGSSGGDPRTSDTFGEAVTRTLGPGTTAFTRFLGTLDAAIDGARGRFEADARGAAGALRSLWLGAPALVLAAVVAAVAGMWPRLREYL